jgi:Mn-dependent DtxR family transcriptional regulator
MAIEIPNNYKDPGEIRIQPWQTGPIERQKGNKSAPNRLVAKASDIISQAFGAKEERRRAGASKKADPLLSRRNFLKLAGATAGALAVDQLIRNYDPDQTGSEKEISGTSETQTPVQTEMNEKRKPNIADGYLAAYEQLSHNNEFFPRAVFSDDLLIAQQLRESNYDKTARSHAGATGVMQNMDISVKDVTIFLERLAENKLVDYRGPIYIGDLEKRIEETKAAIYEAIRQNNEAKIKRLQENLQNSETMLAKKIKRYGQRVMAESDLVALENWRTHDANYSRALGKLFLMKLYNKKYGYGAGYEKFHDQADIRGAQEEILGAYNGGWGRIKGRSKDKWPEESRVYTEEIFNLMDRLRNVRLKMKEEGLDNKDNYMAMLIARELGRVQVSGAKRGETLTKVTDHIVRLFKQKQDELGRELKDKEKYELIQELEKKTPDITLVNLDRYLG